MHNAGIYTITFFFPIHGSMERKQNHNLIPIIIFVFEMFINSLSKSVVLLPL